MTSVGHQLIPVSVQACKMLLGKKHFVGGLEGLQQCFGRMSLRLFFRQGFLALVLLIVLCFHFSMAL